MNGAKGLLAGLLVVLFLAGALLLQQMYFVGREVGDSSRFAGTATQVIRTDRGSELVARLVTDRIPAVGAQATPAVRAALRRPDVVDGLRPAIRDGHRDLMRHPERGLVIATGALRPAVVDVVGREDVVPPASSFPPVTLPVAAPARPAVSGLHWLTENWLLVALLTAIVGAMALGASPRRGRTATAMGVCVAALALVPPAVHALLPPLAELAVDGRFSDLARMLSERLTDNWGPVSLGTLAVGFGLAVLGQAAFRD